MVKNFKKCIYAFVLIAMAIWSKQTAAQLTFSGQIRTRSEFRDGLGTLIPKTNSPSFLLHSEPG